MKRITKAMKADGKVTDKVLTYNIAAAVIGMILCLASLTATTWAWFGDSISSTQNTVKSGAYNIDIAVSEKVSESSFSQVLPSVDAEGKVYYELEAAKTYKIELAGNGTVSTGYAVLKCEDKTLYTEQIFTSASDKTPKQISFTVDTNDATRLYISSCWGTYSGVPDMTDGGDYDLLSAIQSDGQ